MVYEVEFMDNQFNTIETALIHALNVSECKFKADEIAAKFEVSNEELKLSIEEFLE